MYELSSDVNNTPKTNAQSVKYPIRNGHMLYYIEWCEIIQSQNYYSEMYKGTTKRIEVLPLTKREDGITNEYGMKKNLNKKRSCKRFQIWIGKM